MNILNKIVHAIDWINDKIGKLSAYSVIILMLVVVFEVVSRRFFNKPTIWAFELSLFFYGFHFMMTTAFSLLHESMVSIDILTQKLSEKSQRLLSLVTYCLFFFPFIVLTLRASMNFTFQAWLTKENSWTTWAPPVYPIKTIIPIALFFLLLQGISQILKDILFIKNTSVSNSNRKGV